MEAQGVLTGQLRIGDQIEAWHNGKLFHRGRVMDVVPALELFWILDARTGTRKLLDPEALEIRHVEEQAKPLAPRLTRAGVRRRPAGLPARGHRAHGRAPRPAVHRMNPLRHRCGSTGVIRPQPPLRSTP